VEITMRKTRLYIEKIEKLVHSDPKMTDYVEESVDAMKMGSELRDLREQAGLEKSDVAEKVGISESDLDTIERGSSLEAPEFNVIHLITRVILTSR